MNLGMMAQRKNGPNLGDVLKISIKVRLFTLAWAITDESLELGICSWSRDSSGTFRVCMKHCLPVNSYKHGDNMKF